MIVRASVRASVELGSLGPVVFRENFRSHDLERDSEDVWDSRDP